MTLSHAALPVLESILWGPAGVGVEAMTVTHSTRLYRVVLDAYMIGDLTHGQVEWRSRGASRTQREGDLVFGEPGDLYDSLRHAAPGSWHALFITPAIIDDVATELGIRGGTLHLREPQGRDSVLASALARFHRAVRRGDADLERETHLAACVQHLVERHAERRPSLGPHRAAGDEPVAVRRAREFLMAHPASNVSLDTLAAVAGVSKYHLVRAFQRIVGVPPHAYQVLLRVSHARRLIAAGRPLGQVALDAGFAAQSHLNRHFLRVVGVTPGAYRRAGIHARSGRRKIVEDGAAHLG